MVVAALGCAGRKLRHSVDYKAVGLLGDFCAECRKRLCHCVQAVAFFQPQAGGAGDHGAPPGQRGGGRQHRHQVGNLRGVDLDAAQRRARYGQRVALPADLRAEAPEQIGGFPVTLRGVAA